MSDGGKGSSPRPFSVDDKTFSDNWKSIEGFGETWLERKKRLEAQLKSSEGSSEQPNLDHGHLHNQTR